MSSLSGGGGGAAVAAHDIDTTSVHGITDTSVLATATTLATAVSNHEADTTSVHGIANTAVLATATTLATAVSNHEADTTSVHGIADTSVLATAASVATAIAIVGASYSCTNQSAATSTAPNTRMDLTVPIFDTNTFLHATDLWKLVVPSGKGGVYLITASVEVEAHATGFRQVVITDGDGNEYSGNSAPARSGSISTFVSTSLVKVLAVADVISFWAAQNSGTTKNILANSRLTLIRLGPTPA